ncbi:MAG: amidohydrolase family protein [Oscillospiraceae bacterium]|nr:amidohydrolase family protein [Oscillospiraceae bacterium]
MKVIDAHIHYWPGRPNYENYAAEAGLTNAEEYLRQAFEKSEIEHAVVMSNIDMNTAELPDFLSYCTGVGQNALNLDQIDRSIALVEENFRNERCVGLKIYAGYTPIDINDQVYTPFYELAEKYEKPVAMHMGQSAHPRAHLRYSHPLLMDQVAVSFPNVQFVMCHYGNPFLMDAAAVVEKNPNIFVDMSGLIAGSLSVIHYLRDMHGYVEQLKTWIHYVENYEKFMFGTDFPLTDFANYIELFKHIIPEKHQENFYYNNAKRVYKL